MIPGKLGTRLGVLAVLLLLATGTGMANQYWVAYEGNEYPEDVGWWRIWYDIPAERSLEDGSLVLDMLDDTLMAEYYEWPSNGHVDPDSGEMFVMQWSLRVDEVTGPSGPGISIRSDEGWAAAFQYAEDSICATYFSGVEAEFEPGVFHEFELRSYDMRSYELYIDGELAIEHLFRELSQSSRMSWGHGTQGVRSLTRWDYVRYGVVPEPSVGMGLLVAMGLWMRPRLRGYRR